MIKVSSFEWPKCPYCDIEINDPTFIPFSVVMFGAGNRIECPGCNKKMIIASKVKVKFQGIPMPFTDEAPNDQDEK